MRCSVKRSGSLYLVVLLSSIYKIFGSSSFEGRVEETGMSGATISIKSMRIIHTTRFGYVNVFRMLTIMQIFNTHVRYW